MDDEIDDVYEVAMFGSGAYWLDKETYDIVKQQFLDGNIMEDAIEFNTISGAKVAVALQAISDLSHTTKKQRADSRELSKRYRESEGLERKEWEK